MKDNEKTKAQLIQELEALRQHIAEMDAVEGVRQQAEEALRASEQKIWNLIKNSTDAICLFNEEGVIERWNPASEALYKIPANQAIGKYVWDVEVELGFSNYREQGLKILQTGQIPDDWANYEFSFVHADGSTRHIQSRVFMIPTEKGYWGASIHRDISERVQMEKALRESEAQYRDLVENLHDTIYTIDQHYRLTYISPAIESFLGYPPSEMIGKPFTQFICPEDLPRIRTRYRTTLAGENYSDSGDYRAIAKSGDIRWMHLSSRPVIQDNSVVGIQGIATDITRHKEAEETYRYLVEHSLQGLAIFQEGKLVFCNPAYAEMRGYTIEELQSRPTGQLYDNVHPDDVEWVRTYAADRIAGKPTPEHFELRLKKKDGNFRWYESHQSLIQYRGKDAVQSFFLDITERKAVEAGLRESEALFRTLVDATPVATAIIGGGRFLYVNSAWEDVTGYSKSEALAMDPYQLIHPNMRDRVSQQNAAQLASQESVSRYEAQIIAQDGTTRWFGFTVTTIFYANEPALLTVSADITGRRQAEHQRLELALEKGRVQILSNFITQASHEFRTPLSIINTSAYLLRRQTDPDIQQSHIRKIEEQVAHITQLISDLSTLAELDGIQHLEVATVDLNEIVQTIVNVWQATLEEKKLTTVLEMPTSPLLIQANFERLREAIERLWDNALDHTMPGGIITVRCRSEAPNAVFEISDTGSGIREADLPHIFERFYRADEAGTTRGFGLGLPIVKTMVNLHQGNITVESTEGKGSTFRIRLPLA